MLTIKSATELYRDDELLGTPLDSFVNHQLNPSDVQRALEAWEAASKAEHETDLAKKNERMAVLRADHKEEMKSLQEDHAAKLADKQDLIDAKLAEKQALIDAERNDNKRLKALTREGRIEQAIVEKVAAEAEAKRKADNLAAIEAEKLNS